MNSREAVTRYNSLQTSLERRLKNGLQLQLSYTFSHLISDGPNRDTGGHGYPVQDAYNLAAEKAFSTQDQPHSVSLNAVYEIPLFSKSGNWFLKNGLGGWQLNGIYSFHSGLPQTVCLDHDVVGLASGTSICERPNVLTNPNLSAGQQTVGQYLIHRPLRCKRLERSAIPAGTTCVDRARTTSTCRCSKTSVCRT